MPVPPLLPAFRSSRSPLLQAGLEYPPASGHPLRGDIRWAREKPVEDFVMNSSCHQFAAKIQSHGKIWIPLLFWRHDRPRSVAKFLEARDAPAFSFIGIHWPRLVIAAAGMSDMIGTSAYGAALPFVD